MEYQDISVLTFCDHYGIKNEKGEPIEFRNHLFLFDLYADNSQYICCMKCAQVGLSTMEIIKNMYDAHTTKLDIIYTLPTDADVQLFVGGKVNRIIAHNPIFQQWTKDKDTIEQKQMGDSMIYFRGCFDAKTEVLTNNGWKDYMTITLGESLPTLNMTTGAVEDDFVRDISKFPVIDEDVVSIKGKGIDALYTKDHRCVTSKRSGKLKIIRAYEMIRNSSIPATWKGLKQKENAFSEILGWVISEGSYWKENCKSKFIKKDGTISPKVYEYDRVCIIQDKYKDKLEQCLKDAGISYYTKNNNGCNRFELSRKDSIKIKTLLPDKRLTFNLINQLSKDSLESLYNGLMLGDGSARGNCFYQKDGVTVDAFQYLCVLLGKGSNKQLREFKPEWNRFSKDPIYTVGIRKTRTLTKFNIETVKHTGYMWCPTTMNGTVFVRRNGKVYVTGQTWSAKAAIMVTADRLCHDEIDSSKQDVVSQYQARLQHSKHKQIHTFSHPSLPGEGVDKYWQQSDQKHWIITCQECKAKQFLSWPESIDEDKREFVCKKCHTVLTQEARRIGKWIPKYNDKKFSGYWISLLMAPWVTAGEIIDKYNDPDVSEEWFYNKILGLPYVGSGNKVDKDIIMRNLTSDINKQKGNIIIGVDPGIDFRVVIGNDKGLFYYETLGKASVTYDPYQTLRDYLVRWSKAKIFIDQGGDIIGQRKLRHEFPGRVFLCFYQRDKKNGTIFRNGTKEHEGDIYIDRNKAIQLVIDELAEKRLPLQGTESDWYDYYVHWSHIYKVQEQTDEGFKRWIWKRSNRDDYVHATVYFRAGMSRFNNGGGRIFGEESNSFIKDLPQGVQISPFDTISHDPSKIIYGEAFE